MKTKGMAIVIILLILIFALHIIDYFQTMYTISIYGIGVEANPIARFLIENNLGWASKFIAVPIMLAIMGFIVRKDRAMIWSLYILLAFYTAIVINNFNVLFRLGVFN
jgi:hypothetical protein